MVEKKQLRAEDICWRPPFAEEDILQHISTAFEAGKIYAVLGPNGAGKTSLIKILLGFQRASSGRVYLNERPLSSFSRKELAQQVAYLPQNSESRLELPVREVIHMARYAHIPAFGSMSSEDRRAVQEAIQRCSCEPLLDKSFAFLSGGERQRVLCARAIAQETDFIVLDEPVSNLDLKYQHAILSTVRDICRDRGCGIICVMHDINLAHYYADEVLILKKGRIAAEGTKRETLTPEILSEVFEWPMRRVMIEGEEEPIFLAHNEISKA